MSAPPTLVLREDDERTIVDPRPAATQPPPEPDEGQPKPAVGRWSTWLRNGWRPLLAGVCGGALCLSLIALAVHQRRLSEQLRRAAEGMQRAGQPLPSVESTPSFASRHAPSSAPTDARPRLAGPRLESRDELELEAATFVIANDYRSALESYLGLAELFPSERSFSDLVTILRAKLACQTSRGVGTLRCD